MTARTGPPAEPRSTGRPAKGGQPRKKRRRAPSRTRRILVAATMALAPLLALIALGASLGYVRLRHGPIALGFLVAPIERGINAELDGLSAHIGGAVLSLAETGGIELRLQNVRLLEPDGEAVVSAPLAAVEISLAALRKLRVVPSRVELIEPQLHLVYSEQGGLSLSFAPPAVAPIENVPAPVPAQRPPPGASARADAGEAEARGLPDTFGRIDLARVLAEQTARARRGLDSTSYLREIGLRDAAITLTHGNTSTRWSVPGVLIDLEHRKNRSIISGIARFASPRGPWSLTFRTEDSEATQRVTLKTSVRGLVPSTLATALPQLGLLQTLDLPIDGDASLDLSSSGELIEASLALALGKGSLHIPSVNDATLGIEAGILDLGYNANRRRLTVSPSTLRWGESQVTFAGHVSGDTSETGDTSWRFDIRSSEGIFAASEFGVPAVPLESFRMTGGISPDGSALALEALRLRAAGSEFTFNGSITADSEMATTRLSGQLGAMSVETAKAIWPRALAPGARTWVGERVSRATVKGGTLVFESSVPAASATSKTTAPHERLSFALEAENAAFVPMPGMAPAEAPRVLVRVENDDLEVTVPEAWLNAEPGRKLPVKGGRMTASHLSAPAPEGEITFRAQAPLLHAIDLLRKKPLDILRELPAQMPAIEGKLEADIKLRLPLVADLKREAVRIEGQARISDGRAKKAFDALDVQSASATIHFTEAAAEVTGEMLVAGVPFKIGGQRILDVQSDRQPPLRITAVLDDAYRNQLGIDINHMVQGEVPIEITVTPGQRPEPTVQLRADLTNADLVLEAIAWRKPPGRSAFLQFDIAEGTTHKRELQNFRVAGDSIAIEGWAALGADNRLKEFFFPDFSLNVVTRLEVQGKLGSDNVWAIKARGPTFDGRDFFRSLFSVGQVTDKPVKPLKPREGIDLDATIDNVIGFSEVSLRGFKMKMQRRGERLTALDARGTLDGGKPLAAVLDPKNAGPRKLRADSTDAGQAFRLTGFYPNIQGGRVRLEVNLDGSGPAEKTGTLWVEDFRILGDAVVTEVFGGVEESQTPGAKGKRKVVRQAFDFDIMRVPFSVGHGQFAMEPSSLKGPLLGAHLRGKVDYKTEYVNIAGTYVPLQGINNAFENVPLLGDLLSGPRGEGMFGITFAIQGPMSAPQATVNPLSVVAPGIFREIFQLTNPDAQVRPREEEKKATPAEQRVRASSSSATEGESAARKPDIVDGWSSETRSKPPAKGR
ncbi:MAG: AsmA-like C-terminal region-containing protein [Pseudomonadota bacterium]